MMLMNLFESFDPAINQNLMLNWIVIFMYLMLIPHSYWLIPSRLNMMWINFLSLLYKEFMLISSKKYQSNILMFISLMLMIMMMNFLSLMPYIFTITSHMSFNLIMSFSMWISMLIFNWINLTKKSLSHLVPLNTPFMLMNFMVYIELISNIIRPWTLSIRLTANLIAGHLLLTLIGSSMSINNIEYKNLILMLITILTQNLLFILEISMAMIQAYVYSILLILYFSEIK